MATVSFSSRNAVTLSVSADVRRMGTTRLRFTLSDPAMSFRNVDSIPDPEVMFSARLSKTKILDFVLYVAKTANDPKRWRTYASHH